MESEPIMALFKQPTGNARPYTQATPFEISHRIEEKTLLQPVKVSGLNRKHAVLMYALSTCIWCKRAKKFLSNHQVEYSYIDIDLLNQQDRQIIERDIMNRGGQLLFPTIIIDDHIILINPREDELKQVLEINE
jgi:glutaredoxin